ncbi:Serine protease inhibitor 28 [Operophtera brumata]|uniref:Serine protease inhibitor 28 n=1 Tax=Operophtera brumata TaxID=104452 RepID=A0A0L7L697_OPEBR|nr:Serine protease inhibitor 28 [Operophtera brumata]
MADLAHDKISCLCKDGYLRDENGVCVPKEECKPCCPINEVYDFCIAPCPPRRCDVDERLIKCAPPPKIGDPLCVAGCRCADGYYRNNYKVCVTKAECPPICTADEVYSECINGGCLPVNCSQIGHPVPCVKLDPKYCIKGCLCKVGYLRDENEICDKPNEEYVECPPSCPERTCESIWNKSHCCPKTNSKNEDCVGECRCKEGYYRSLNGECLCKEDCLKCTGDHEYFSCGPACDNVCCDLDTQSKHNCPILNKRCVEMCYCADGYARDDNRVCVCIDDCPEPKCKGKHEVYSKCIQGECRPKTCSEVGCPIPCPRIDPKYCKKGCICKEGYVKNKEGVCIPIKQCPPICKKDEVYSECINGGCSPVNCSQLGHPVPCVKLDPKYCIKGCLCKDDYLRDVNGVCVPIEECKPVICCGKNEVYENCTNPKCRPETCCQVGFELNCTNPPKCTKGCVCKEDYVRCAKGICIPIKQCPSCGGDENAESGCGNNCLNKCYDLENPDNPRICPMYCKLNETNEVWFYCPIALCVPKTCQEVGFPVACLDLRPDGRCPVKPGCICREGYVRNYAGICIPMEHCRCGTNCNRLCSNYNQKHGACAQSCFYNSCECRPGFVFDEIKRRCVFPSECCEYLCDYRVGVLNDLLMGGVLYLAYMNCTKKNEVYDPCPAPCPYRTCGINDAAVSCVAAPYPGAPNCAPPMCRCRDGYYRNDVGDGLNEMYDPCPAPCPPQRCDVNIALILCTVPPALGDPECEPGCRCIDDHVRDYTGVCIPKDQCPTCPNPNEVYDPCIAPCPPRRCDVDERLIKCGAPPKIGEASCVAGCRCADGYYRNSLGVCVTKAECPSCDGPHEYYACGGACDNVCATLHEQNQTNCPIVNIRCNDMCYCDEGYARDDNNICIPIENDCIQGNCRPKNCSQLGFPVPCSIIDPKFCKKGCLCNDGYVRDIYVKCVPTDQCPGCGVNCNKQCSDIGKELGFCITICYENACDCKEGFYYDNNTKKCVLPKHCTPSCGTDEVYSDCVQGNCSPQNCTQLGFPIACQKINPEYCKKGCLCKEGYVRNEKGVCIPVKQCPSCGGDPHAESGCGINCGRLCSNYNKEGVVCTLECQINGLNCSQIGLPIPCVKLDPKACIRGCLCKEGYLRDDNGICVPTKECKPKCNMPNEYYEPCDYDCPPQTCESLDRAYVCPIREGDTCKPQCKCMEGYYRNKIGECITEEQCRKCMGPHEYFSCGGACDNVCATLHKQNQAECPIINIKCNEMCYCEKDYARAMNGTCIPIQKCYEPQCGTNKRYEKCPAWLCEPQNCCDLGYPTPCPFLPAGAKCPVKPACVCVDGYVKNYMGKCIPKKECPSCGGDSRAQSGCGVNCGKKCEDLGNKPGACIDICNINGCDCRDGYYYDNKEKKCVLPSQCTSCGGDENAELGCGVNCMKKCYDVQNPNNHRPCPRICKVNSCDCKTGFYYDDNTKKCVPPKECKCITENFNLLVPTCCEEEVYDSCVNGGCEHRNCSQINGPILCIDPIKCIGGCTCKEGYLRLDDTGACVSVDKCPSKFKLA